MDPAPRNAGASTTSRARRAAAVLGSRSLVTFLAEGTSSTAATHGVPALRIPFSFLPRGLPEWAPP